MRSLLCSLVIILFCVIGCSFAHGDHYHEDDGHGVDAIQRGKEKWFKQPEEIVHHDHDHHHHDHDHHHHDHGHYHEGHGHHHHDHGHYHEGHDHHHHEEHDHHHHHEEEEPGCGCGGHNHDDSHDHHHGHTHEASSKRERSMSETIDMWWQAIFATGLISAAPFFILFFVPLESNAESYQPLLKVLLGFASGGLLGDAFLHLIPHAIQPHSHGEEGHDHSHSHGHGHHHHDHDHSATTNVGMCVLAGILTFLCIEKFVRYAQGDGHHHHHHHEASEKTAEESTTEDDDKEEEEASTLRKRKPSKKESEKGINISSVSEQILYPGIVKS